MNRFDHINSRLTIIESPYAGDIEANTEYARKCCLHSFILGENPFASHLFYPQFLDEHSEADRASGISLGYEIGMTARCVAFYVDEGWSPGMETALRHYSEAGVPCEIRRLEANSAPNGSSQIDTPDEDRA